MRSESESFTTLIMGTRCAAESMVIIWGLVYNKAMLDVKGNVLIMG